MRLSASSLLAALCLLFAPTVPAAAPAHVALAAAANLTFALDALNAAFAHEAPNVAVTTTLGSSGNLFAQISHGAPFDLFLSADDIYPRRLVADGFADGASLRSFARGRLVFWTMRPDVDVTDIRAALQSPAMRKIAIAQANAAPYGRAAEKALRAMDLWAAMQPKVVVGENIAQTAQFVQTGNADAGFVALSFVTAPRLAHQGRWTEVDPALYAGVTLDQTCVLTTRGAGNEAARQYLAFLRSATARKILEAQGYQVPP